MNMVFGPGFWALGGLGVTAALGYGLLSLGQPPSWPRALFKTLFMAALTGAFASAGAHPLLLLALAAAACGDFFLAFDKKWLLPFGILSFLIAQLAYFVAFAAIWFFSGDNSPLWPRYAAMAAIVAASLGFLIWMAPKLGWLALGVGPYAIAITAMACMAMWLPWAGWPAMLGAVSFLVSDLALAAELFRLAPDAPERAITRPLVWWSYAAAQVLIVWGIAASV